MSTTMEEKPVSGSSQINPLGHLTRQQLKELEQKEKTRGQKILDLVIMLLPVICGFIAVIEYWEVPNGSPNSHPYTYVWAVAAFMTAYALYALAAGIKYCFYEKKGILYLYYKPFSVRLSIMIFQCFFVSPIGYFQNTYLKGCRNVSMHIFMCFNPPLPFLPEQPAFLHPYQIHPPSPAKPYIFHRINQSGFPHP